MHNMATDKRNILIWFFIVFGSGWFLTSLVSCGKGTATTPKGINIQYHVVNLSPDLFSVDLFINNQLVNSSPFVFNQDQGYFYLPSLVLPFQIRSAQNTGTTYFTRNDALQAGAKYTLYIIGDELSKDTTTLLTVDTSTSSPLGTGKLRFVNVSPTATGGLDLYANGTLALKNIVYKQVSGIVTLPVGNYDLQIDGSGTTSVLNEMQSVTIQDGRLYTLYAYGYTTRADTAAFSAALTTNR
jgi:hypothetical protein